VRSKVTKGSPEAALMRVLDALAQELSEASDEEVLEAAKALRMDLTMPESAAWAGVTYFARPRLDEFFDIETHKKLPDGH